MPEVAARQAVEALRNGVPNRDAVRELGCNQPEVEERFAHMLAEVPGDTGNSRAMLVSGGFGTGKSHLLSHLEQRALAEDFVCSRVAISKETPLYNLEKVFAAAMESGRLPGHDGRLMEELSLRLNPSSERYEVFIQWVHDAASRGDLHPIFPASLIVHQDNDDFSLEEEIEAFWSGDRMAVANLRRGLKEIHKAEYYPFSAPRAAELPPKRLRFVVELIKAAGYRGWVVLLDEIELVASYSILQRGRAYAELARWMGRVADEALPGLVVVGAVTDDFAFHVINPDGHKRDKDKIGLRLGQSRYKGIVEQAEIGMQLLERECVILEQPGDDELVAVLEKLRGIYEQAYGARPPAPQVVAGAGIHRRMRHKIRTAINEWDLHRLYPDYQPETEVKDFSYALEEDSDIEWQPSDEE